MIITIDGPAGAGKSRVASEVAKRLRITPLDTGSFYRAITCAALEHGYVDDEPSVLTLVSPDILGSSNGAAVSMFGQDVREGIRGSEVTRSVSKVAAYPRVRQALGLIFREIAASQDLVVEGRDAGTVLFPQAETKIFLDASASIRALRRVQQNSPDVVATAAAIARNDYFETVRRDFDDCARDADPLRVAPDAIIIATDNLGLEEVVSIIVLLSTLPRDKRPAIVTSTDCFS